MRGRGITARHLFDLSGLRGNAVRDARTATGLTQEKLAEKASLSKNAVGNIERGEFDVTVATLARIAAALGRSGSDMLLAAGI